MNRRIPDATRIHYALSAYEDDIIQDVWKSLQEISGVGLQAFMFDGLVVRMQEEYVADAKRVLEACGSKWLGFHLTPSDVSAKVPSERAVSPRALKASGFEVNHALVEQNAAALRQLSTW